MAQLTIQQAFDLALQHHSAGQLDEAEKIYQQIITAAPRHADALHNLGVLAQQRGNLPLAIELIQRSIAVTVDVPERYNNLSAVLRQAGRTTEAISAARRSVALRPDYVEGYYNLGLTLKDQGDAAGAIDAYHHAISLRPNYTDACNNLGIALGEKGHLDDAIALYRKVIAIDPANVLAHLNLGIALHEQEKLDESHAVLQALILHHPNFSDAHNSLGTLLRDMGKLDQAVLSYQRALSIRPDYADAQANLARVLNDSDRAEDALAAYGRAIASQPKNAELYHDLGNVCRKAGRLDEAITAYQNAIAIRPDYVEVMNNLAVTLRDKGRNNDAEQVYLQALAINPDYADAASNLSLVLKEQGRVDEAIETALRAVSLNPDLPEAYSNLAHAYMDSGQLDESIAAFRQAIARRPSLTGVHSAMLYTLNLHPDYTPQRIADEHRAWDLVHARPLAKLIQPHRNSRDPDRRLRIGYVSPDFRHHALSCFMLKLLENHDRAGFEIFCYAELALPDHVTDRVKKSCHVFRNTFGTADDAMAQMIRQDRIDILVDLAGHTAGNRLLVFAQKPAPVQVNYQGYPATTGVEAIDYRLTDVYADPPGMTDSFCSEKLVRLPQTNWCYQPLVDAPAVNELPALTNRYITFGCFNNFSKVNAPALKCWAKILQAVPNSKLLLKGRGLRTESVSNRVRQILEDAGARPDQLDLRGWVSATEHLSQYGLIDIALDAFPYNGTTTTCEALLMGVPVVTFFGSSHVARVGGSLMTNMGLTDLVGDSVEQYVKIAIKLSNDLPTLAELRRTMRSRLEQSPLMDGPGFARDVESAYRQIWQQWCDAPRKSG